MQKTLIPPVCRDRGQAAQIASLRHDFDPSRCLASPDQSLQSLGLPTEMYSYDAVGNRVSSAHQPGSWSYNQDNQTDPIGLSGGINLFGYVGGDPINRMDTTGLAPCGCSEKQLSLGVSLSIGGWPVGPGFFGGGGMSIGVISNGAVFLQFQASGSVGLGLFAGVGVQGGLSSSNGSTPSGLTVSRSGQLDFAAGAGASVGMTAQGAPGSISASTGNLPGIGKLGVGLGLQVSAGVNQTVTAATPPLFPTAGCP